MRSQAVRGGSVCRRRVHRRGILVHGFHLVRQPGSNHRAVPHRNVRRYSTVRRARLHRRSMRRCRCSDVVVPLARARAARRVEGCGGASRRAAPMKKIIFACVHNAGRSQMAAAFFNLLADPMKARAISAGTPPGERVHPEVVTAMKAVGIDLTDARPQRLTAAFAKDASMLVTMGCGDECPVVPGAERDDWPLPDPK